MKCGSEIKGNINNSSNLSPHPSPPSPAHPHPHSHPHPHHHHRHHHHHLALQSFDVRRSCSAKVTFLSDCIILLTLAIQ